MKKNLMAQYPAKIMVVVTNVKRKKTPPGVRRQTPAQQRERGEVLPQDR